VRRRRPELVSVGANKTLFGPARSFRYESASKERSPGLEGEVLGQLANLVGSRSEEGGGGRREVAEEDVEHGGVVGDPADSLWRADDDLRHEDSDDGSAGVDGADGR
jgi:hypothetical protein